MPEVILPVLDEAEALPWVLGRLPTGWRAIVVDNGSRDGSAEIARRLGARVIVEPRRGFGAACAAGLNAARADVVAFMDADGSLDPADLVAVWGPVAAGRADLVLGRRVPASRDAWSRRSRIANAAVAIAIRRRTRLRLHDLGPMRVGRRATLLALGITDRRFGWPLEMVLRAAAAGWRIAEVDVPYRARVGRSKVTGTLLGTLRTVRDMTAALR
jgi:glycosyltransferase involved in cell wall biosynthesis